MHAAGVFCDFEHVEPSGACHLGTLLAKHIIEELRTALEHAALDAMGVVRFLGAIARLCFNSCELGSCRKLMEFSESSFEVCLCGRRRGGAERIRRRRGPGQNLVV